jgi:hypothetical protein
VRIIFFVLFLISAEFVFAQVDSSLNKTVLVGVINEDFSNAIPYSYIDTTLNDFHHYSSDGKMDEISLGNLGFFSTNLLFTTPKSEFSFGDTGFLGKSDYKYRSFKNKVPFARMSYLSGPKKLQSFNAMFSQSVNKRLNFSVAYNTYGSNGLYISQVTSGREFNFSSDYNSKQKRYGLSLNYHVKSGSTDENGGIKSDSLYTELIKLSPFAADNNKLKIQVWQENAENRFDHREVRLLQYFRMAKIDSTKYGLDKLVVGLNSYGSVNDLWYVDNLSDSLYYAKFNQVVQDSFVVSDQVHDFGFRNNVYFKYELPLLDLFIGSNINHYQYSVIARSRSFHEYNVYFKASNLCFKSVKVDGLFSKGVSGYNSDGYYAKLGLQDTISNYFVVEGALSMNRSLPEYKMMFYQSSILNWDNDFNYTETAKFDLDIFSLKLGVRLTSKIYNIKDYVYYGKSAVPVQFNDGFWGYTVSLGKNFKLGNFHLDLNLTNQYVENSAPVNLASWIGKASLYHQRYLFKNAMELRYGIDYWQTSKYHSDYYAPFNRSFVYQQSDLVGNYPYIDVYFSARIKSAQGFIKFQNVGQIIFRENYMMVPYYPLQDFGFAFGISWDFFN